MKEGYLQLKIAELNDKCNQIEQTLSFEDAKIKLIQEKIGEYKEVIKKLQDIQDFKTQSIARIREENERIIKHQAEHLSCQLSKLLEDLVKSKANTINTTLHHIQKREEYLAVQSKTLEKHSQDLLFLLEYLEILMMKLVNKNVLSGHDVAEMERRAKKKAQKNE